MTRTSDFGKQVLVWELGVSLAYASENGKDGSVA